MTTSISHHDIRAEGSAAIPITAEAARIAALEEELRSLRAENDHFHQILDSAAEYAIVTMDLEGRISSWNAGARKVLGYAAAEILGRSGEIFFAPEDRAEGAFVTELCRALDRGRAVNERWHLRRDGSRFWASGLMLPLMDEDGQPQGFLNILRDGSEMRAEAERQALIQAELAHRVRNTLSLAHVIAVQTLRHTDGPEAFQAEYASRLQALGRSHEMLAHGGWDGAPLRKLVEHALTPHRHGPGRVAIEGLPVRLASAAVVKLSLAFHELTTNAAKYGSLSVPEGAVEVTWSLLRPQNGRKMLEIVWRERGGPPVKPPERRGFGTRLLEQSLRHEFGCTVTLAFEPEGLECRICLPLTANVLGF
ncbi:PAS domain S-box-containing protein [Roseomonas rosea]|uniref:histidine kinase n=1 Tax=Muricoccus roseus TaxID=198092 RepID=A0A1M6FNV5_9PROT|nr:HWE histidine kinase domain-containing protein [Roseomonas rosea]SHI99354.1 PAS domain S-box-containing protein [Roseomonas rosea]